MSMLHTASVAGGHTPLKRNTRRYGCRAISSATAMGAHVACFFVGDVALPLSARSGSRERAKIQSLGKYSTVGFWKLALFMNTHRKAVWACERRRYCIQEQGTQTELTHIQNTVAAAALASWIEHE